MRTKIPKNTIGIYCIEHRDSGKKYIGKSKNIHRRFEEHRYALQHDTSSKGTNKYLYNAVKKYGLDSFDFYILQKFDVLNVVELAKAETFWIEAFDTLHHANGYNLSRDTSTLVILHPETIELLRQLNAGNKNKNFQNFWSTAQKSHMSAIAKERHASGKFYDDEWVRKISANSTATMQLPGMRARISASVSKAKRVYYFYQFTREGVLVRIWNDIAEIVCENPEYKWQNIYSACNGHKPTYRGFVWKKVLKEGRNELRKHTVPNARRKS